MAETLYPINYGTRMVTFDVLQRTFSTFMHPEAARRAFNFILLQGGKFGIGSGYRSPGAQPNNKPGFAPPGKSFHEGQQFPSGLYYVALDMVVVNPGRVHRAPVWAEVPAKRSAEAKAYGVHFNVPTEPWHMQPIELDGYATWVANGKKDLALNYPIKGVEQLPPVPPVIVPPPTTQESEMKVVSPAIRVVDTRTSDKPLAANEIRDFAVMYGGTEAMLNITVVPIDPVGFIRVWPRNVAAPATSNVNWAMATVSNLAYTGTDGGWIKLQASSRCHVIIDLQGAS